MRSQTSPMHTSPHHRPFIRDEQWDKKWVDAWNNAKPAQRKQWLKDAGYERSATAFMYRAWHFITQGMRHDVITIIKREQQQRATQAMTAWTDAPPQRPQFWWNKEND